MTVKMLTSTLGSANEYGSKTRMYEAGEEIIIDAPWKQALVDNFIGAGVAEETKVVQPTETKSKPRKRARNADGTLKGDDPTTPDINEAWETK